MPTSVVRFTLAWAKPGYRECVYIDGTDDTRIRAIAGFLDAEGFVSKWAAPLLEGCHAVLSGQEPSWETGGNASRCMMQDGIASITHDYWREGYCVLPITELLRFVEAHTHVFETHEPVDLTVNVFDVPVTERDDYKLFETKTGDRIDI